MVLKLDRRGIAMRLIFGDLAPHCAAQPWLAVLHEHAVEESGDIGGTQQLAVGRSEEHTSELQSLMRISYAVFCLKKKNKLSKTRQHQHIQHTDKAYTKHHL